MQINKIRADFPFLASQGVIYLDNAATTQKPDCVISRTSDFYAYQNATVHRGIYGVAETATQLYESARTTVAKFISGKPQEVIFTAGATAGINFVCDAWAEKNLNAGDEIIITEMEHHSNILCWLRLAQKKNLVLKYIPVLPDCTLDYKTYLELLTPKTRLVSFVLTSNAVGTINDAQAIISAAKYYDAAVLVDAAQTIAHEKISIQNLGADFLVFSGHKIFGPTGIGVLFIAESIQTQVDPYQVGGGMVYDVDYCSARWLKAPHKFEAGTPPVAQAIGLAESIEYVNKKINFLELRQHESQLIKKLIDGLSKINHIKILGPVEQLKSYGHIVSFVSNKFHPHDIAAHLDNYNIFVRAGNHCCQLLFKKLALSGSIRVSVTAYNTEDEIENLVAFLKKM